MSDDDIAALTYEQALAELDSLIARLEAGSVGLDEAIACYERGSRLLQRCADLLDRTEERVMKLVVGPAGVAERPLEPAEVGRPEAAAPSAAPPPAPEPESRQPRRPSAPPPPSAPLRARPAPAPGLFPGLEQPRAPRPDPAQIDPDDIPF